MTKLPNVTLIFPAYNERATIRQTVEETLAYFDSRGMSCEIIVAADGTDGTREVISRMAATDGRILVTGGPQRCGKGKAIREAVTRANGQIVGYADADNKVPIEEYDKLDPLLRKGVHIVIGSRAMDQSTIERKQPWFRRWGSSGFRIFMQTVVGLPGITDTQCGFKFFQRDVVIDLFSRQSIDGYMFDVEILSLAQHLGYRIEQVPIRWRDDGDSRLNLVRGNLQNVRDIFRIAYRGRRVCEKPAESCAVPSLED